jgi:hypothetical protein
VPVQSERMEPGKPRIWVNPYVTYVRIRATRETSEETKRQWRMGEAKMAPGQ